MASVAAPITNVTPVLVTTPMPAGVAPAKNFLNHCSEELEPSKIKTTISTHEWYATLWKVNSIVTLVVPVVAALGAFVAVGLFFPTYIPLAAGGAVALSFLAFECYRKFDLYSTQEKTFAEQLKTINHHYVNLTGTTADQVQAILTRMGVDWTTIPGMALNPANLTTLKPLIAYHQMWEGVIQGLEQRKTLLMHRAQELAAKYEENSKEIYKLHQGVLQTEQQILVTKIRDAFVLAAIRKPAQIINQINSIGDFFNVPMKQRAVALAAEEPRANNFFVFKNNAFGAITYPEVKRLSTAELSQRLALAAPAV